MLSHMDKLVVLVGSLVCVLGLALGMKSSVTADDRGAGKLGAGKLVAGRPAPVPAAKASDEAPSADEVDWAVLNAYEYVEGLKTLPDEVRALEGKEIIIRGFLTPLYEFDDIHEFVLVANHMSCCFGMPAGISGQVQVKIAGAKGLPNTNEPLEVRGTFHAVETKEQGYILSIYRIDDAKVRIVGYR